MPVNPPAPPPKPTQVVSNTARSHAAVVAGVLLVAATSLLPLFPPASVFLAFLAGYVAHTRRVR